jgi:NADPH-dependent 2,4-dienoyl-CoA reductase/sulfur reductase-like enzyme
MKFLIIGAGAAGLSALKAIRELDSDSEITILTKEDVPPYSLSSLPFNLAGEIKDEKMSRFDDDYFQVMNAKVAVGKAIGVLTDAKKVLLDGGSEIGYDRLLITSGSSAIVPRITGLEKEGVHTMGSLSDTYELREAAKYADKIVVIGAGFVGLEAAIALRKLGKEIVVVEMLERVLPRMLDPDMAAIAQKMLESNGIELRLGDQVKEVLGEKKANGVKLSKDEIKCDLVVVGIGVRPNIELVKGTAVKTNMGIVVDDKMQTTVKDVYAAGDIVETPDPLSGKTRIAAIWPNAIEQGRVAGRNMAGVETHYPGPLSVNVINIFDVPVVALGLLSSDIEGAESLVVSRGGNTRKLVIKDDKAIGVQSIGYVRNLGFLLGLINKGEKLGELRNRVLDERFAYPVATR